MSAGTDDKISHILVIWLRKHTRLKLTMEGKTSTVDIFKNQMPNSGHFNMTHDPMNPSEVGARETFRKWGKIHKRIPKT